MKTNNWFYFSFLVLILVACGHSEKVADYSNEEVAEMLIKDDIKDFHYESIKTKVDSAFAPYDNPELLADYIEMVELGRKRYSIFLTERYVKAEMPMHPKTAEEKRKYLDDLKLLKELKLEKKSNEEKSLIRKKMMQAHLNEKRRFVGFKAIHKFSYNDYNGTQNEGYKVYFIDAEFKKVVLSLSLEEYNGIRTEIDQYIEMIHK